MFGGMAMIIKVGVYCRLSNEDRDKINKNDDSDSITNQRSMCIKYALKQDWDVVEKTKKSAYITISTSYPVLDSR